MLSAHLSRMELNILALLAIIIPLVLFYKNTISIQIVQTYLVLAGVEWIRTMFSYTMQRIELNEPWLRLAIILGLIVISTFASVYLLTFKKVTKDYNIISN